MSRRKKVKKIDKEYELPKALRKEKAKKTIKKRFIIFVLLILLIVLIIEFFRIHTWKVLAHEMTSNTPSSVIDTNGKVIAEIGAEKIKEPIEVNKIPTNLKNAYISIEDQRFYKHHGVDIKRTSSAIASYIIHFGKSSFGGSSITQQLVKNITGDDTNAVSRKVTEWIRAISLEIGMSKDEILESYFNIIYVGPNIYGVQAGSTYYFDKDVNELSLAECAFLAGINHSPNSYNPFNGTDKTEKISKRTKTVLNKMLELKHISKEEYDEAVSQVNNGFNFKQGTFNTTSDGVYSYHTDALVSELVNNIASKKHISTKFATNYLNMAGLKIYSTQDSSIQNIMENEFAKGKYILKSNNDPNATSQSAMVIIDHTTGNVVGCVGGLGKKTEARSLNRAVQTTRQTGSAIKPVAILGPALQEKIITPVTTYDDSPTSFDIGKDEPYSPIDYDPYLGTITVRRAVESSQNIPFVKMMEDLTPAKSIKYMKKLGITTLTEKDENLPLALGGLEKGMSPLETASAYATIANNGVYISPTFYSKVENSKSKVIIKAKHKKRRVFSEATCYVLKQLLIQPVVGSHGTATYCSISNMDVAAKTGTTNENYDRWLCGFTPYYTAATWYGFDLNESINFSGKNPAGLLWAHVMNNVHSDLSGKKFEMPKSGVTSCTICSETNKLANSGCPNRYTEYFIKGTMPDMCSLHSGSTTDVKSNRNTVTTTKTLRDEDVPDVEETKTNTTTTNTTTNKSTVNSDTKRNNTTQNTTNSSTNSDDTNTAVDSNTPQESTSTNSTTNEDNTTNNSNASSTVIEP
ncbi:MAG: penicillin-binding protein [Clostridia bacterium]|nr:penicillin-binding protein [Clostridia bacterium]